MGIKSLKSSSGSKFFFGFVWILFYFTRKAKEPFISVTNSYGGVSSWLATAIGVFKKILHEARLQGSSR